MQISTSDLVSVRRARWRVADIAAYERCALVSLVGAESWNAGVRRQVLTPFDEVRRLERPTRLKPVSARLWVGACRALIARDTPPGGLRSALSGRFDLLAHQLEPAMAVVQGLATRVLLADEVGLGKTVQAGLMAAELRARGAADRILVATPPGLRDQWAGELGQRFALEPVVADARSLRRASLSLPVGANPWLALPFAIASIDYLKRTDVLADVAACRWDLLIVDEAHTVARQSDRRAAVAALARQIPFVVLVTATPHSGDRDAFLSLCSIGAANAPGDLPLLTFRRSRGDLGLLNPRRIRRLLVRPSAAERTMLASLGSYIDAVRGERAAGDDDPALALAASVLQKRAWSSARSLQQSVERRLASLGNDLAAALPPPALPFADPDGELTADDAAPAWPAPLALRDLRHERRLLEAVLAAARRAAGDERKIAAVRRLLRRVAEPVVVFTEYRDTLAHVQASLAEPSILLHGGLSREERARALEAFAAGSARLLLATDAAGEGLNLHRTCRLVVNLELPWNPTRLEQRIGRVDRIGQSRTVHAIHVIGRTHEAAMLARLHARVDRARADVNAPDPLGTPEPAAGATAPLAAAAGAAPALRTAAAREAARLAAARALVRSRDSRALDRLLTLAPCRGRVRRAASRAALGRAQLAVWQADSVDGRGRTVDSAAVAALTGSTLDPRGQRCVDRMAEALKTRRGGARTAHRALVDARLARERAIADARAGSTGAGRWRQPGLFDRRAERARLADAAAARTEAADTSARLAALDRAGTIVDEAPRLLLVLTSR